MKCMKDHIENEVIDIDNFAQIYRFAFDRGFTELKAIAKRFMKNNISLWVAKDWQQLAL